MPDIIEKYCAFKIEMTPRVWYNVLVKSVIIFVTSLLFLAPAFANTDLAKKTLSQTTTNPFCSSGYAGPNPFEKKSYERPDPEKSICEGQDVIKCYRDLFKK